MRQVAQALLRVIPAHIQECCATSRSQFGGLEPPADLFQFPLTPFVRLLYFYI